APHLRALTGYLPGQRHCRRSDLRRGAGAAGHDRLREAATDTPCVAAARTPQATIDDAVDEPDSESVTSRPKVRPALLLPLHDLHHACADVADAAQHVGARQVLRLHRVLARHDLDPGILRFADAVPDR